MFRLLPRPGSSQRQYWAAAWLEPGPAGQPGLWDSGLAWASDPKPGSADHDASWGDARWIATTALDGMIRFQGSCDTGRKDERVDAAGTAG